MRNSALPVKCRISRILEPALPALQVRHKAHEYCDDIGQLCSLRMLRVQSFIYIRHQIFTFIQQINCMRKSRSFLRRNSTLEDPTVRCTETSGTPQSVRRQNTPEEQTSQLHQCESQKSRKFINIFGFI